MAQKHSSTSPRAGVDNTVSPDTVLKISKEIAVKFIEVGRLTPATFDETFKSIHQTIEETVHRNG